MNSFLNRQETETCMKKRRVMVAYILAVLLVFWLPATGEGTGFNADGQVDIADFILFARGYEDQNLAYDLNADGGWDLEIF